MLNVFTCLSSYLSLPTSVNEGYILSTFHFHIRTLDQIPFFSGQNRIFDCSPQNLAQIRISILKQPPGPNWVLTAASRQRVMTLFIWATPEAFISLALNRTHVWRHTCGPSGGVLHSVVFS